VRLAEVLGFCYVAASFVEKAFEECVSGGFGAGWAVVGLRPTFVSGELCGEFPLGRSWGPLGHGELLKDWGTVVPCSSGPLVRTRATHLP
jgi:hypothetical protein